FELERFRTMGELPYAEQRKREAYEYIQENPSRFAVLSAKRFVYYWAGQPKPDNRRPVSILRGSVFLASSLLALYGLSRALRVSSNGASLLGWLILSYPAIYYFVYAHARYRHPIEPELVILIVFAICSWRKSATRTTSTVA